MKLLSGTLFTIASFFMYALHVLIHGNTEFYPEQYIYYFQPTFLMAVILLLAGAGLFVYSWKEKEGAFLRNRKNREEWMKEENL